MQGANPCGATPPMGIRFRALLGIAPGPVQRVIGGACPATKNYSQLCTTAVTERLEKQKKEKMSETFATVDPEIFAAVQEMIEKDSAVKEVCPPGPIACVCV